MSDINIHTYSLSEVAAMVLPKHWKEPVRWLQRHLVNGEIAGYKVGHDWRMTADDVTDLVARHRNVTQTVTPEMVEPPQPNTTPVSILDGLSARSRRRIKSA